MEWSNEQQSMELVLLKRSATSYQDLLEAQKDLFQSQIMKLQNFVATQCKLTGVNPLSQEMAAGALSIKIGKRPRDLLNPKAIRYMQFAFSIKDAVSKRETREISTQFGVTATQNGVKPDFLRNPFTRHLGMANASMHQAPGAAVSLQSKEMILRSLPFISKLLHQSSNSLLLSTDAVLNMNISGNSNYAFPSLLQADGFGNISSSTASMGISQSRHLGSATTPPLLAPKLPHLPVTPQAGVSHSFRGMQSYYSIDL